MTKEVNYAARQQLLIDALKSGEYAQSKHCLRSDKGYCCLGVATDIYHKETGLGEWESNKEANIFVFVEDNTRDVTAMSDNVRDWFKFDSNSGIINGSYESLMSNNDRGDSFIEIAKKIEENQSKVFIS